MHPIAFEFGSLRIHWYGVLVALGFIAGLWTASRRGLRDRVPAETVLDAGPWLIIGALMGARLLYVVSYWKESFAGQPWWEPFMIHHGGLVYYGGLFGASAAFLVFAHRQKVPLWRLADILAPSIPLGHAFGRLGCFMNGCCYGQACDLPWAVQFPFGHASHPHLVHPTQLYESLLNLGLYAGLAALYRRKRFDGQVFSAYLLGYAILRSVVEGFRGDYGPDHVTGWLTPGRLVSLIIATAGIALWRHQYRPGTASGKSNPS